MDRGVEQCGAAFRARNAFCGLWLERLSTDRITRQSHEAAPLVVFGKRGNLDLLLAVDAKAQRLGLTAGLALAQARAMHPALAAVPEDQAGDARLLDAIADWCQRYTPLVAIDPPDGILLDIGGCAHLFGGEAKLRDDLLARVTGFGLSARAAIATTIGTAWAAARFGDAAVATNNRECLAPLPLAALRLPPDMVTALARLGLKRIGDILDLPRAPLAARFGVALLRQLDRALGREDEPLTPRLPVPPYVAERSFHEPIAREEDVLATVERLAARLQTTLTTRGDGARRLELALFRTDGVVKRIAAGTSRPTRDPQAIRALFVERLAALGDEIDPGFGFDLARLSVLVAEPCPDEQIGLGTRAALASEASGQRGHSISARAGHAPEMGSSAREDQAELDRLVDRLSARLGRRRVSRLVANDSHIPELAAAAMPAQMFARKDKGGGGWDAFRRFHAETGMSPRPLRLLAKPEPIDEVMALVPDGRRCASVGGAPCTKWSPPKAPSASPAPGGASKPAHLQSGRAGRSLRSPARRATISVSRTKRGCASGCFAQASIAT